MPNEKRSSRDDAGRLHERLTNREFLEWYEERKFERNLLQGKPAFNEPGRDRDARQHSPSHLLRCHRQRGYADGRSPREGVSPRGRFWTGTRFESDVILQFLRSSVATSDHYVTESMFVDYALEIDGDRHRIRGLTDPAIVDAKGHPILVTEIKLRNSLDHTTTPAEHHRAQLQTYLRALAAEYPESRPTGVLVYADRDTFELRTWEVDREHLDWSAVVDWMSDEAEYQLSGELPPATPEMEWECGYCEYSHRCGQESTPFEDEPPDGLLPTFAGYDRGPIRRYLRAYSSEGARLTPTLASRYPDLADAFGAYDWECRVCGSRRPWEALEPTDDGEPPWCPNCHSTGSISHMSGPPPSDQLTGC